MGANERRDMCPVFILSLRLLWLSLIDPTTHLARLATEKSLLFHMGTHHCCNAEFVSCDEVGGWWGRGSVCTQSKVTSSDAEALRCLKVGFRLDPIQARLEQIANLAEKLIVLFLAAIATSIVTTLFWRATYTFCREMSLHRLEQVGPILVGC